MNEWAAFLAYTKRRTIMADAPVVDSKPWYQSKTIIFNIVSAIVAAAGILAAPQSGLPPIAIKIFSGLITVGNIALRFQTDSAIK